MFIPKKSTIYKNVLRDKDKRGEILSIIDETINNVSLISCNPKSIRSNHYHKTDWHFIYVLEGKIDYFFKKINSKTVSYFEVKKGDNIFSPPLEIHATFFPVKTKLIVCSRNLRDQKNYEKDTVRVKFIDFQNINFFLKKLKQ